MTNAANKYAFFIGLILHALLKTAYTSSYGLDGSICSFSKFFYYIRKTMLYRVHVYGI